MDDFELIQKYMYYLKSSQTCFCMKQICNNQWSPNMTGGLLYEDQDINIGNFCHLLEDKNNNKNKNTLMT